MEQNTSTPIPSQTQQPVASTPLSNEVKYSLSLLGVSKKGTLNYDGKGNVWLIDSSTQEVVFSQPITNLGKVRRAENGLYLKPAGQFIFVMFGDAKDYAIQSGATMNLGLGGLIFSNVRANQLNKSSGLEIWVNLLQQAGVLSANFSPNNMTKLAVKIGVIILVLILIIGAVVALTT